MSDHLESQLAICKTFSPVCRAQKSFLHPPCVPGSPLESWEHSLAAASPCYSDVLGETVYAVREDVEMASSSLELEDKNVIASSLDIMAFGSEQSNLADAMVCSRLQQNACTQVFKGLYYCPQLWMHNNAGARSSPIMTDQIPELSHRLSAGPDATCMAAPRLESVSQLQSSPACQLVAGNVWSAPMRSSHPRGRCPETGHGLGIVNSQNSITQYPIDPAFAERAAKFCSFRRETYEEFGDSPPLLDARGNDCDDGAFKNRPKKLIGLASNCSSQGLPSLLSDRRTADFALGLTRDVKAPKEEILDESTSAEEQLVDEDRQLSGTAAWLCSPYALVDGKACASQEGERRTMSFDEATSDTRSPNLQSSGEDAEAQDTVRFKRERTAFIQPNEEKNAKKGAPVPDLSLKRQKSLGNPKKKDKPGTEDDKRKNNESGGESSKAGKVKATKPVEAPKLDYIHVRARRGQATDSHSLAERVRREKISERMRFLQNLVPGCSKITGKAMMLDEIINYVQSLQHQVEFLAMKLAALNPRLDFNVDSFLERQINCALGEIDGTVSELTSSAGTQIATNYIMQMQRIPGLQISSADNTDYGVPSIRRMSTDDCNRITGMSLGRLWERKFPHD